MMNAIRYISNYQIIPESHEILVKAIWELGINLIEWFVGIYNLFIKSENIGSLSLSICMFTATSVCRRGRENNERSLRNKYHGPWYMWFHCMMRHPAHPSIRARNQGAQPRTEWKKSSERENNK